MAKKSVEDRIIGRLSDFNESLKSGEKISEKYTSRKVSLTLESTPYDPALVRATRKMLCSSQSVFAMFLGVSLSAVQSWEQGKKEPNRIACRFMDEIRRTPEHWNDRLRESMKAKEVV